MQPTWQQVQNLHLSVTLRRYCSIQDRTRREKGKSDSIKDHGKMESVLPVMSN